MSKVITFQLAGKGEDSDAPTVDDMVDQLRDYFDLLELVEGTVAVDGGTAIEWRIVDAHTNSPISFKAQAFPRQFAVNVDARVAAVIAHTAGGLRQLQSGTDRPPFFTDQALQKAERIFQRVTNGLALTLIDVDGGNQPIDLKPSIARVAARNTRSILEPSGEPYREIGSVEGYFQSVSWDGFGRRVLQLKHRLTGDDVKCFVKGGAEKEIGHREISDVWRRQRISVFGTLHYKAPGRLSHVEVTAVRFLRREQELPSADDIIDPDFTGGLRSEIYLEKLRNGEIS